MAWNFIHLPKEVLAMVNLYRFDGTPSAKAVKAYDIIHVEDYGKIEIAPKVRGVASRYYMNTDLCCSTCDFFVNRADAHTHESRGQSRYEYVELRLQTLS